MTITQRKLLIHIQTNLARQSVRNFLTPTRIYVKPLLKLIDEVGINTVSHITGGGFIENVPRMLPDGLKAVYQKGFMGRFFLYLILCRKKADIPERDNVQHIQYGYRYDCCC